VKMGSFGARKRISSPRDSGSGWRWPRALVKRPKLLLLDEPLARSTRSCASIPVRAHQHPAAPGRTFTVVTHDQEEAMTPGPRLGVMTAADRPDRYPIRHLRIAGDAVVADFIGSVNMFEAK